MSGTSAVCFYQPQVYGSPSTELCTKYASPPFLLFFCPVYLRHTQVHLRHLAGNWVLGFEVLIYIVIGFWSLLLRKRGSNGVLGFKLVSFLLGVSTERYQIANYQTAETCLYSIHLGYSKYPADLFYTSWYMMRSGHRGKG